MCGRTAAEERGARWVSGAAGASGGGRRGARRGARRSAGPSAAGAARPRATGRWSWRLHRRAVRMRADDGADEAAGGARAEDGRVHLALQQRPSARTGGVVEVVAPGEVTVTGTRCEPTGTCVQSALTQSRASRATVPCTDDTRSQGARGRRRRRAHSIGVAARAARTTASNAGLGRPARSKSSGWLVRPRTGQLFSHESPSRTPQKVMRSMTARWRM